MGLSAGTGWRAFGLGLFSYGRAAVFRCPPFLRPYGAQMGCPENLSSAPRKSFCVPQKGLLDGILPVEPDSGCRLCSFRGAEPAPGCACDRCRAPAGCTAMPARSDALRGMGARAFSPAGLCAMIPPGGYGDAGRGLYIKRSGDTPVSECRRRVGPSARCPSHSVCSQSAVSRRLLLRQKEEKVLQLPFCSAAASTSSGRFAKKSKPVSRSILSTETT